MRGVPKIRSFIIKKIIPQRNAEIIHIATMAFISDEFGLRKWSNGKHTAQDNKKYFHVAKLYYTLKLIQILTSS